MNIIWTNWKMAFRREWDRMPLFAMAVVGFGVLVCAYSLAILRHTGMTSLFDDALHFALFVGFPLSGLLFGLQGHEREMTATPLSFCLPRYRQSLRCLGVTAAVPWGLYFVLIALALRRSQWHSPGSNNPNLLATSVYLGSAFLIGAGIALTVQAARLILPRLQWSLLALASLPLAILGVGVGLTVDVRNTPFWIGTGLVSIVVMLFCWVRLGNMRCVGRGHRAIIEDAMDKRTQADVKRTAPPWMDDLLLGRARECPVLGIRRYVWAGFYRAFGRALSYRIWVLAGALALSIVLGLAPLRVTEIAFVLMGFEAALVDLPATSSLLLPGGCRERHYAMVVSALLTSVLLLTLALGIGGLSGMIAIARGADAGSLGFRFRMAWLACVLVPWIGAAGLRGQIPLGFENRLSACVTGALAFLAVYVPLGSLAWLAQIRLLFFASACLCGWVVFLFASRRLCLRGSLIGSRMPSGA